MKTLTATLEAAQRASTGTPYVEALFADYWGYVRRARPVRVYTGAEQVLQHAAALSPGDGSLIRVRLETSGTDTLYVSRVATPGAGSTFSSWTALTTDISDVAGVAIAVARNIDSAELIAGRRVALLLFDPSNPDDMVVCAVWT